MIKGVAHKIISLFKIVGYFCSGKGSSGSVYSKPITPATLGSSPAIINLNNTLQSAIEGSSGTSIHLNTLYAYTM